MGSGEGTEIIRLILARHVPLPAEQSPSLQTTSLKQLYSVRYSLLHYEAYNVLIIGDIFKRQRKNSSCTFSIL